MRDHTAIKQYLKLLFWGRWIVVFLQLLIVFIANFLISTQFSYYPSWIIAVGMIIHNFLARSTWSKNPSKQQYLLFIHLLIDIFWMYLLLFFYGGKDNPFAFMLIFQVIIAATVLSSKHTWTLASLVALLYISLFVPAFFSNHQGHEHHAHHSIDIMQWHLYGMLLNFVALVFLISFVITRLVERLKKNTQWQRESEDLLVVGHWATSTAHMLGTPLATMAIVVGELEREKGHNESLEILQQQIQRAKSIVESITDRAKMSRALQVPQSVRVADFFEKVCHIWQKDRSGALEWSVESRLENVIIVDDGGLKRALFCLLDNAYEASAKPIKLSVFSRAKKMIISLQDYGPGFRKEILDGQFQWGESQKKQGMGLGLFLVHSYCGRVSGKLRLSNNELGAYVELEVNDSELVV